MARARTVERCLAAQRRTGRQLVFALGTALDLQGIERPRYPHGSGLADGLYAVIGSNGSRTVLRDVRLVLWPGPQNHVSAYPGRLRCTDPVTTWAMHANRLEDEELVVLGDSMMRRNGRLKRAGLEDFQLYVDRLDDLERYADLKRTRAIRGITKMRRAIRLMREDTDSSQETRTRIALMRYGLPCPEVNHPIRIGRSSQMFLADMAYPDLKVIVEYDGRHHASQWLADIKRREALEDEGWLYVQVTAENLVDESSQEMLSERVAQRMSRHSAKPVKLRDRMIVREIVDGRRKHG